MNILAAIILAIATVAAPTSHTDVPAPPDTVFPQGLPWAYSESECYSARCVWDAERQGNGNGQSMLLTAWQGGYIAQPISHRRAHRLQAAWCERPSVACEGYDD
jgi:hypothetical protein